MSKDFKDYKNALQSKADYPRVSYALFLPPCR